MKLFHRHITSRVKRYSSHLTKYLYERDTIFATIWVFLFIIILGSLPINFYFLNPLKLALKDFDFNDITYSNLGKGEDSKITAKDVVIINVGHEDREGLAMLIDKAASYEPKVMGLDVLFYEPSDDPYKDSLLAATFSRHKNLVVANKFAENKKGKLVGFEGEYFRSAHIYAHVNFFNDPASSTRFFYPFEKDPYIKKKKHPALTAAMMEIYNPEIYKKLKERDNDKEYINYTRRAHQYVTVQPEQLMTDGIEDKFLRGKIILFGYVNEDPNDIEDKKFTPMNSRIAGKSTPDMNGIVVHANIISMMLEDNYIKKLPSWVNWLVAILICWLHMSFFVRYYLENHIWFHLVAKIAQLLSAIFFAYIGMLLFDRYNIKLDMKLSLIVIVMAVDVIYFYEAFAVWLHKKFNYHTVFHQKHH